MQDLTWGDAPGASRRGDAPRLVPLHATVLHPATSRSHLVAELIRSHESDAALQQIAALVAAVCGTTRAAVSLVDDHRHVYVAQVGLDVHEIPLAQSLCAVAVRTPNQPLLVVDAASDPRFVDHPAVTVQGVRAYAGVALVSPDGIAFGALCAFGDQPTRWTADQVVALDRLAAVTVELLQVRRLSAQLVRSTADLRESQLSASQSRQQFQSVFDHAPIGMTVVDSTGTCVSANAAFAAMLGRSQDDIVGSSWTRLTTGADARLDRKRLDRLLAGGTGTVLHEKAFVRADGQIVRTLVSTSLVRTHADEAWLLLSQIESLVDRQSTEPRLTGLRSVLRDVSQRRLADTCADLIRRAASTANSVDSLTEATASVLEDVCTRLGWVAGRAWTKDGSGLARWFVAEHAHDDGDDCSLAVLAATNRATFAQAFPRDLTTHSLHAVADLARSDISGAIASCGVGAALSVPVLAAGEVAGLFGFYLPAGSPPPPHEVTDALEQIGVVLGQVVERERSMALLAFQATHDPLTHLANRRRLLDEISAVQQSLANGLEHGRSAALLIDIDRFKMVNDSLGYVAGDQLLQEVSRRILSVVGPDDVVGRLGSDEFVVLTRGIVTSDLRGDEEPGVELAERLHTAISGQTDIAGQLVPVRVSIGVCPIGAEHAGVAHYPAAVLRDADAALRRAKGLGRSRIEVFDARLRRDTATRMDDETALSEAIASGNLALHYQPIMSFDSGVAAGAEALVRWPRAGHGLVPPNDFIPMAEESGLIIELGRWVLMRACIDAAIWPSAIPELAEAYVSVNVSMRQLAHPQFLDHVDQALQASGLDPARLVVEITESSLIDDAEAIEQVLLALRGRGIRLALDDFGTGYSSLGYVKALAVDILKIDKSFVDPITGPDQGTAFSEVVLKLAEATGMRTVAEGVESADQAEALKRLGCDSAQGFLWSRPVPTEELSGMFQQLALRP